LFTVCLRELYEKHIPSFGYINELNSPKELADYLLYLDRNKTAYNSYFKWKNNIRFENQVKNVGRF
jgi:hypothetical protein